MDRGACRSCGALVGWARTAASGRPMPLSEDDVRGNVIIDAFGRAHAFRDHAAAVAAAEADFERFGVVGSFFLAHHVVCPAGERWRGARRGEESEPTQAALF